MKHRIFTSSVVQAALVIACTALLTLTVLLAMNRYDNKYITKAALTQDQFCIIPENGYCALVDGWELYSDVLLSPDDFRTETPSPVITWAGEYPNLALFHADKNPYGTATWRLHLQGNGNVSLYLQEPLCATRVFVNGRFLGGLGNVSAQQYSPLIKDAVYSFSLDGAADLIIQTANYSHYYGGIWYAPVIGDTDSISRLIAARMLLYGLLFLPDDFKRIKTVLRRVSLSACGIVLLVPLLVLPAIPTAILWYGPLISWYKVIMAGILMSLTVYGCFMKLAHVKTTLAAAAANGLCLFYGVLTIETYEPFIGAYPEEYGAFGMVLAFAVLMVRRSREMATENQKLRLHLQEEVQEKTQHLQKLLTERSQLIAELGHDMKSPLTSLSNMAQIIRMNDFMLDADARKKILHIEEQCGLLSERLKSIQEIAAWTSTPQHMEPIPLNTFLLDFYRNCKPIVELYGPNFHAEIPSNPCHVIGNPEQLFRALENLLYNAADFTPPDGTISLSLTADEQFAYIAVSDTGCGIAKEDLPHIFERSYTTRAEKGGEGLGLAITKTILLEHAGKIEVVSKVGKGTTFTVWIPLAAPSEKF